MFYCLDHPAVRKDLNIEPFTEMDCKQQVALTRYS